jgi:hypothetical protein
VSFSLAAELQTLLEGVPLPAGRERLIRYAVEQGAGERELQALRELPDRQYRSLDELGEEVAPVQPRPAEERKEPRAESGEPPGGDDYTRIPTDTGQVRD